MSIATKAKNNKKRNSSRSRSHSHSSSTINISSSLPNEPLSSSSLVIKRQISKEPNRRSSPLSTNKHRATSSADLSSRHSSARHRHRSPANHDRHRSDVTLYYFIFNRLTYLVIIYITNHILQYRTFKKDLG